MTYDEQILEIATRWERERTENRINKKIAHKFLFEEGFSMSKTARLLEVFIKFVKRYVMKRPHWKVKVPVIL